MRARAWLILSLGLNILLGAGWYSAHLREKPASLPLPPLKKTFDPFKQFYVRTNVVVRRQNFTWQEVESSDYSAYIKNLRTIGCPEQTIRDIIVADVDQLYTYRRGQEVVTNDFQWWRYDPDTNAIRQASEKSKNLEDERRTLLTRLLGPNWDKSQATVSSTTRGINLNGPVLGELSAENKQHVYDMADRAQKKREAYFQAQRNSGATLDSGELARMRQEFRNELAQVLSPEQMEEFLLRYSETAERMRRDYRGIDLTAEEFRMIFRARDPMEQEIALLGQAQNTSVARRLVGLQSQVDDALKRTLGTERYSSYKLNQDPLFRNTKAIASRLGASPEATLAMYRINQATEAERQRIRNDTTLSSQDKIEAMATVQAEQQKSLEQLLGQETFQKWADLQEKK